MKQALEAEFTTFVVERGQALLRIAHAMTGNKQTAEDLVQNALAKAYARWPRIHGEAEAYVRKIIYNDQVSAWRRAGRRNEVSVAEVPDLPGIGRHDQAVADRLAVREALPGVDCADDCLLTWLPNGKEVALPEPAKNRIRILSVTTGGTARIIPVRGVPAGSDAWSTDGRYVLVTDGDQTRIAETATGRVLGTVSGGAAHFVDGDQVLTIGDTATLHDLTGKVLRTQDLPADLRGRDISIGPAKD